MTGEALEKALFFYDDLGGFFLKAAAIFSV